MIKSIVLGSFLTIGSVYLVVQALRPFRHQAVTPSIEVRTAPEAAGGVETSIPADSAASLTSQPELRYRVDRLSRSQVHRLQIPIDRFEVVPAVSETTALPEVFAQMPQVLAVLNGGFFDPHNQQTTSYIRLQGQLVADPAQNDRLMQNPDLATYLDRILDRSEFRRYQCGSNLRYDIARHRAAIPDGCELLESLGAGPQLLPEFTAETEGFLAMDDTGTIVRDALGSQQPNARTAIGITATGDLLWVMVAQQPEVAESGMTLLELTDYLRQQGAVKAMNLDGGSSSALWIADYLRANPITLNYMSTDRLLSVDTAISGITIYGRYRDRDAIVRPVKSVLLLKPRI
jgi:hypothetical protein